MPYVDAYILPLSKGKREAYRAVARKAGDVWMRHGALQFWEAILEDPTEHDFCTSFAHLLKPGEDETIVVSFITFRDRAHRDEVNEKAMADPEMCDAEWMQDMPFDCSKMAWNGFETLVVLGGPADG